MAFRILCSMITAPVGAQADATREEAVAVLHCTNEYCGRLGSFFCSNHALDALHSDIRIRKHIRHQPFSHRILSLCMGHSDRVVGVSYVFIF